jgi:hypothetical protein
MKTSGIVGLVLGATMSVCLALGGASAEVFDFSFSGGGLSGSGILYATGTPGDYVLYGASGTASDVNYDSGTPSAITGVSGFGGADNLLFYPNSPYVDYDGIGLDTADGNGYNLYYYGGYVVGTAGETQSYVSFSVTPVPVPEPSTWAMMILGFAGLGFAGYRRSRKAAAVAA